MVIRHTAKNLSEYIDLINVINSDEHDNAWFRGHGSAAYRLQPSVLRDTTQLADSRGNPLRGNEMLASGGNSVTGPNPERMLDEFKRRAIPFLTFQPKNDFEWLFLMQHHGVPTRLLDWTTNALVALYFAVEFITANTNDSAADADVSFQDGDEFRDDGVAIFALNPHKINETLHDIVHPVDVAADYEHWNPYTRPTVPANLPTDAPLCILAPHITPRIRAQSGTFTLHGSNIWALDYYSVLRPLIHKIFIPYTYAKKIREELHRIGVTISFIYPDLDGLSREIKEQEFRLRYPNERKAYLSGLG